MKAKGALESWNLVSIVNESDDVIPKTTLSNIRVSFIEVSALGTSKGNAVSQLLSFHKECWYAYAIE